MTPRPVTPARQSAIFSRGAGAQAIAHSNLGDHTTHDHRQPLRRTVLASSRDSSATLHVYTSDASPSSARRRARPS